MCRCVCVCVSQPEKLALATCLFFCSRAAEPEKKLLLQVWSLPLSFVFRDWISKNLLKRLTCLYSYNQHLLVQVIWFSDLHSFLALSMLYKVISSCYCILYSLRNHVQFLNQWASSLGCVGKQAATTWLCSRAFAAWRNFRKRLLPTCLGNNLAIRSIRKAQENASNISVGV